MGEFPLYYISFYIHMKYMFETIFRALCAGTWDYNNPTALLHSLRSSDTINNVLL